MFDDRGAIRVYIAAPYSKPDPCENTNKAIKVADSLLAKGYIPFIPHLTHFWHTVSPKPYRVWVDYDAYWAVVCNVILRLPGESLGSDSEVELANKQGIPVVHSVEELETRFPIPEWRNVERGTSGKSEER